ncbi:MAG: cobyrinate a,c-diamide synthase [Candidatus Thiodiazotropha sp.]
MTQLSCPALMISAPASGSGKTTVVAALARLHSRQGRKVRVFKCGPDFLDPQIHAIASSAPCENIDLSMCGEADARWRLARAARDSDLILIEDVMGLYDSEQSGAAMARILGVPILLVVDAQAMAGSFGAVCYGLKHYRDGAPVTAALANRVGSDYHAELCRNSLTDGIAWSGALMRNGEILLPERHLGLLPAVEIADLERRLDHAADTLKQSGIHALPPSVTFDVSPTPKWPALLTGKTIAVADDAAFCFRYPANEEYLREAGAELVFFSPLYQDELPACDAVWLPGGYPELHAETISENRTMKASLQSHVAAGKPLLAECGGMMACFEHLISINGTSHSGFGLLPGESRMQVGLAGLGLLSADLPEGSITGHCFHYSTTSSPLVPITQARKLNGKGSEPVYRHARLTASYMHAYFPSNPLASARLFLW